MRDSLNPPRGFVARHTDSSQLAKGVGLPINPHRATALLIARECRRRSEQATNSAFTADIRRDLLTTAHAEMKAAFGGLTLRIPADPVAASAPITGTLSVVAFTKWQVGLVATPLAGSTESQTIDIGTLSCMPLDHWWSADRPNEKTEYGWNTWCNILNIFRTSKHLHETIAWLARALGPYVDPEAPQ
jgi:hypothetical protein